jgi:hypothetical protein
MVKVKWVDSTGFAGGETWQNKEDVIRQAQEEDCHSCWSVGFVVCEDENQITLTLGHNGEDGFVMDPTTIPKCAVEEVTELVPKLHKGVISGNEARALVIADGLGL